MIIASYNIHVGLNGLTGVSKNLAKKGIKSKEENLLHGSFVPRFTEPGTEQSRKTAKIVCKNKPPH